MTVTVTPAVPRLSATIIVAVYNEERRVAECLDSLLRQSYPGLEAASLSHCLQACDVMLQPYPDGVSSRRTTAAPMGPDREGALWRLPSPHGCSGAFTVDYRTREDLQPKVMELLTRENAAIRQKFGGTLPFVGQSTKAAA